MTIVLISPYSGIEATGLRILSACLKEAGFRTRMIFLPNIGEAMAAVHFDQRHIPVEVAAQVVELCADADLVGITVMTPSFHLARTLTEDIHARLDVPVIWGGVHPTICPEESLTVADMVCVGEGEALVVELAQRIAQGRDFHDLQNLAFLDTERQMVVNRLRPLVMELDLLPFPDYDYSEHYVLHEGTLRRCTEALVHYYLTDLGSWASGPVYGVTTTRGCPYRCTYCANNAFAEIYADWNRIRRRSPANVIAEIKAIRARLPAIMAIILRDDTFLANPRAYIEEFCQQYKQEVGLPFRAYTTAQTVDKKRLSALVDAGLSYIIMGIQSGSPRTQNAYRRTVTNDQLLRAAETLHDFERWAPRPTYDVITDNPYEDELDRYQTLKLIHQLPMPYRLSIFSLTFYPGTELAEQARQDGKIVDETSAYRSNFQMIEPNYYNLALFCHSLNLPRPLLIVMTHPAIFRTLRKQPFDRLSGRVLSLLFALRLRKNQRTYGKRRALWLSGQQHG